MLVMRTINNWRENNCLTLYRLGMLGCILQKFKVSTAHKLFIYRIILILSYNNTFKMQNDDFFTQNLRNL